MDNCIVLLVVYLVRLLVSLSLPTPKCSHLNKNIKRTAALRSESQNWHENIEMQFCKEGAGFVLIDGKCHAFSKGDNMLHF